jgi:hypothetical protein
MAIDPHSDRLARDEQDRKDAAESKTRTKLFSHAMTNENPHERDNARLKLLALLGAKGWHASSMEVSGPDPQSRLELHARVLRQAEAHGSQIDYLLSLLPEKRRQDVRTSAPREIYLWLKLADQAAEKLGPAWRGKLPKLLRVTPRRLQMWEECKAAVPDSAFLALGRLPDLPAEPEQPPVPDPPAEQDHDEWRPLAAKPADNMTRATSIQELFKQGRQLIEEAERGTHNAAFHGLEFGRLAREAVRRFKEQPKAKGKTQRAYLENGFGKDISTINRWHSVAAIVDDPDVPWADVDAWCGGDSREQAASIWKAAPGADRVKAMRKAYDQAHAAAPASEEGPPSKKKPPAKRAGGKPQPDGPARLTSAWFVSECLAVLAGLFREALVTVTEEGVSLQAMDKERMVFLRASFPPIAGVETAAWLNIKTRSFQTGSPRSLNLPEIRKFPWQHIFELDHAAEVLARHKLGGDAASIGSEEFGDRGTLRFALKNVQGLLRKKPQLWAIAELGMLGAVLERDDMIYEFFVRASY